MLLKVRKPSHEFSYAQSVILKDFEHIRKKVKVTKVLWEFPQEGWIKYNADGASRGNLRVSSYAFYHRNEHGYLLYQEELI